jgi:hypothetical protein
LRRLPRRSSQLEEETISSALALIEAGLPPARAARQLGIGRSTLYRVMAERKAASIVVEEWKSARTLRPWHRAQMGVYFLLVEEELRIRPSHGFIVLGDSSRHRIDNTEELRAWVLDLAGQIRAARATVTQSIPSPASAVLVG